MENKQWKLNDTHDNRMHTHTHTYIHTFLVEKRWTDWIWIPVNDLWNTEKCFICCALVCLLCSGQNEKKKKRKHWAHQIKLICEPQQLYENSSTKNYKNLQQSLLEETSQSFRLTNDPINFSYAERGFLVSLSLYLLLRGLTVCLLEMEVNERIASTTSTQNTNLFCSKKKKKIAYIYFGELCMREKKKMLTTKNEQRISFRILSWQWRQFFIGLPGKWKLISSYNNPHTQPFRFDPIHLFIHIDWETRLFVLSSFIIFGIFI